MTDNSSETTAVIPTVEPAAAPPQEPVAAPAAEYRTVATKPTSAAGTPKAMIVVASVVLGLLILGATFASGAMVGSHFAGGRRGIVAEQQGQFGGPGAGMNGGEGFERGPGGRHGGRGLNGQNGQVPPRGQGQSAPQGQMPPQGQTAPQGQLPPQGQPAPGGSTGQPQ
jgi:hypothetical protein